MGENVSAIIPAYNEEKSILSTLEGIRKVSAVNEIIVVDDGSTDLTYELLKREKGIILLKNNMNRGKGYSVRSGLKYASNNYIALVDGDLRESAAEFEKLTNQISNDYSSIIIGILPAAKGMGGFGLVKCLSYSGMYILTSVKVNSILCGQRIIPAAFLREIELPEGFALEFKITLEAVRRGLRLVEIPVNMHHRVTGRDLSGFLHRGKQYLDILRMIKDELSGKQEMH